MYRYISIYVYDMVGVVLSETTHKLLAKAKQVESTIPFRLSTPSKKQLMNIYQTIQRQSSSIPTMTVSDDAIPMETAHLPKPIQHIVESRPKKSRNYVFRIHNRDVEVLMVFPQPTVPKYSRIYHSKKATERFFERCIHKICVWLMIAIPLAEKRCAEKLHIQMFFTDHKKTTPEQTDTHIDREHANTAYTYACVSNSIMVVFRIEEWFKVFIHETFHTLGLDFAEIDGDQFSQQILKMFPGCAKGTDIRLSETYCEMWAEILNLLFMAYYSNISKSRVRTRGRKKARNHTIKSTSFTKILSNIESWIRNERAFSVYQASTVMRHYGIRYQDFCQGPEKYSEKTPVFSYYIIKTILMFHLNDFLQWTTKHSLESNGLPFHKTSKTIREYIGLIGRLYKAPDLIQKLDELCNTLEETKTRTLRMSLYEFE